MKSVTNISNLSPTHLVSNIHHQHQCNRRELDLKIFMQHYPWFSQFYLVWFRFGQISSLLKFIWIYCKFLDDPHTFVISKNKWKKRKCMYLHPNQKFMPKKSHRHSRTFTDSFQGMNYPIRCLRKNVSTLNLEFSFGHWGFNKLRMERMESNARETIWKLILQRSW